VTARRAASKPACIRPLALAAVALALGIPTALAIDFGGYAVVKLHRGLNDPDLAFAGRKFSVAVAHRENFNAHSFDVVTVYLSSGDPSGGLDILGFWDKNHEELTLTVSGGADCLLHDFRLLKSTRGAAPMLVVADRPLLGTYADNEPVSFKFYVLRQNTDGLAGEPAYWFDRVETQTSKGAYCDVGAALARELGLGDYRTPPRPDDYWNSPAAMSPGKH
jgi:hypothetical protein